MAVLKNTLRMVVTQHSYRMANRLRQVLVLADYQQNNIFEVIETNELLQVLREKSPIHLAMLTPAIVAELERTRLHEELHSRFPDVVLLFLWDEEGRERIRSPKIIPDYVLMPPVTAESLDTAIAMALENREYRTLAAEHIARGEAAIKQGLFAEAQASFESAVRISGPDPYPCYAMGELFATMGNTEQAIVFFAQAWEKDRSYFEAVRRIVEALLSQGDRARAIPYLESAAQEGAVSVEGLVLLGTLYIEEGSAEQANAKLRAACRMENSQAIAAMQEQVRSLVARKAIAEAITLLQVGIEVQPENPQLYEVLGDLLMDQQRFREALACYQHVARLSDPLAVNYCRLARAYMALGFILRAEKALQQALDLDPDCAEAAELRVAVVG